MPGESGPGPPKSLILRRGNGGEPQTLDPSLAEDDHAFHVLTDLYEGLVVVAADGSLAPGVAETFAVSEDGLRYVFRLREDAKWSNGAAVTAEDFVAGIRRAVRPGSISPYSFLFEPVANYAAVTDGRRPPTDLGVAAPDRLTLIVDLETPAYHLPNVLAMPIAYPSYAGDDQESLRFRDAEHFIGNGPYLLSEWSVGAKIRLRKNPLFRSADNVQIEWVEYFPVTDPDTELNMFRAGELDITATVPPAAIRELQRQRTDELRVAPALAVYYLAFDLSEAPFDNALLRQSVTMAIDRAALVELLGRGEQAAYSLVPPGVADYDRAEFAWKNLADEKRRMQARKLFAEAGYATRSPLKIKLTYDAGDIHETVALAVAAMWRDVLGIEVELDKKEWKFFLATRQDRSAWQVMRFAWTGDYNDASTFTQIFHSDSPQNLPDYRNARYDRILDQAAASADGQTRSSLMTAAEEQLINDYPIAPLYFYVSKHLVATRVDNFQDNPLDRHPSRYLRLSDD